MGSIQQKMRYLACLLVYLADLIGKKKIDKQHELLKIVHSLQMKRIEAQANLVTVWILRWFVYL